MDRTESMAEWGGHGERRVTTLVHGAETDGRLALVALDEVQGHEPPRHLHADEDEVVYVLGGALTFWVGGEARRVGAGACLLLPRGTEHGYAVETGTARLLIVLAPAGCEGFVTAVGPPTDEAGLEHLIATAARHGIAITGPPPTPTGHPRTPPAPDAETISERT